MISFVSFLGTCPLVCCCLSLLPPLLCQNPPFSFCWLNLSSYWEMQCLRQFILSCYLVIIYLFSSVLLSFLIPFSCFPLTIVFKVVPSFFTCFFRLWCWEHTEKIPHVLYLVLSSIIWINVFISYRLRWMSWLVCVPYVVFGQHLELRGGKCNLFETDSCWMCVEACSLVLCDFLLTWPRSKLLLKNNSAW